MLDLIRIFRDTGIPYDSTINAGWINVRCPFCGDSGLHLGFRMDGEYCNCWRCGGHGTLPTLKKMLNLSSRSFYDFLADYEAESQLRLRLNKKTPKAKKLVLPGGELNTRERRYLEKRGFDPDLLVEKYRIQGGGIVGKWSYRILIPLFLNNQLVSWTARDITGKSDLRYLTLPIEESVVDPKTIFYNCDNSRGKRVAIVEGPTDVWRMGDGFICSFGTSVTQVQINFLARNYREVFLVFDPEPIAQERARHYAESLAVIGGIDVWIIDTELDSDPGDMSEKHVRKLRRELGLL